MEEYKDKRYSGLPGQGPLGQGQVRRPARRGEPDLRGARRPYVEQDAAASSRRSPTSIGAELGRAKARIATGPHGVAGRGRQAARRTCRRFGKEAAADFAGKFDDLTRRVDEQGQRAGPDAGHEVHRRRCNAVDEEIEAEKEANKGLIDKAMDAVVGVIKTIIELKNLLLGVLAKAAWRSMTIIKDPIGFLGNLVSGGRRRAEPVHANIGEHLQKGLVAWLLGHGRRGRARAAGEVRPRGHPRDHRLDARPDLGQHPRPVSPAGVPDEAMATVEASMPLVARASLARASARLWEDIKERVGDLKETLLGKIAST